jgi:hypothetical protein
MESFLESGGGQIRGGRIAFLGQRPGPLDIRAMAHGASLGKEILSVDILREGH